MKEINLKGLNETIYYDECDNGLKVYMWVNKRVNTFYGTLSVKYGSIYDEFKVGSKTHKVSSGVAHFLEHVKFNEKKDYTAHDFFNKNGCDTNAFTTFHYTNYQVFGSENPKDNIVHLVDFVQNDYFTKAIVNNEKGIIVEEAKMGEDDPYTVMLFKHLENIFNKSSYKNIITGKKEEIKKITLDDIKLVFDTFYHPENMFLIITGNFNPYEVMEAIKENQNSKEFKKFDNPVRVVKNENKKVAKEYEEININVTNRKIKIGIKIPKKTFKGFDDLHIRIYLSLLLKANFGTTSDFKDMLLEKELINSLSCMNEIFDDYVTIMFTIDSNYKEEIIKLFSDKLDNLEIDENTFNRMKKANIASLILEYEDVECVNSILQSEILNYGNVLDNLKEIYENIKYDDLLKFISLLNTKERSTLILNPIDIKNKQ
ncbi:MAG: insulinase family protein [Bacilli bacterium]|nr:insulinase family protein [Bacilli bacterium]